MTVVNAADGPVRGWPGKPLLAEEPTSKPLHSSAIGKPEATGLPRLSVRATVAGAGPFVVLAVAVGFGLYVLRVETLVVAHLNDEAFHLGTVQLASTLLRMGRDPLSAWYPLLNLGSPEFLHYQSLPAIITGAAGLVVGVPRAFAWSTYLLLATWPISTFLCARLLGWSRWTAAAVACASPLIMSAAGLGYEYGSYLWIGYGVWTQLWAMWTLPLAIGFSWQAISQRRHLFAAVLSTALTVAFHYETGYLAGGAILVLGLAGSWGGTFRQRIGRAAVLAALGSAAAGWVLVPVISGGQFAARNEFLQNTADANSFGAPRVLRWLTTGQLFDKGRLPVLTVLLAVGLVTCVIRFRHDERCRVLVLLWAVYLVAFFGRPTLGPVIDLIPGSRDLFMRRFVCGVDLASLLLVGVGAVELTRLATRLTHRVVPRVDAIAVTATAVLVGIAALAPAWTQVASYAARDAKDINVQSGYDATQGAEIGSLLRVAEARGGGRVYAGLLSNWGKSFRVGYVPVYEYLAGRGVDSVGFTLRTASLMSDAEPYFDDRNSGDYAVFGVRYLLLPEGMSTPVPAQPLLASGPYTLWRLPGVHYVQVVDTVGSIAENRTDIGAKSSRFLESSEPGEGRYLTVAYAGSAAAAPTLTRDSFGRGPAGTVVSEHADLERGTVTATVDARRTAVVVLSASFDPGWRVTVDGRQATTQIIVPAMPGVRVSAGVHVVRFTYVGYQYYWELFVLCSVSLALAAVIAARWRREDEIPETRTRRTASPESIWGRDRSADAVPPATGQ
jgi:hypothetical protein